MSNADPQNDFATTIANLNATLTDFGPLVTPIDNTTTIVTDIDDLLKSIVDMIKSANVIDDIILVLGDVLEFLDGIPIVGEIAAVMGGVVETIGEAVKEALTTAQEISSEVITPMEDILNEIQTGLSDFRTIICDISQKVPGYLNTVEILSYLAQIGEPLSQILDGTKPGEEMTKVLKGFNTVQEDLGKALSIFDPVMKVVGIAVKDLAKVLDDITNAMGTGTKDILNDIEDAVKIFQPISDGFKKLENAIKPLAWVLDALACIFNKILKPIIDLILKATGLDNIVHKAEKELMAKIGIGPVFDAAQKSMKPTTVSSSGNGVSSKSAKAGSSDWSTVIDALGVYKSSKDGNTKKAVWSLINAITGGSVDPNKPYNAPPFQPSPPNLTPATNNGHAAFFVPRYFEKIDPEIVERLEKPEVRHHTRSLAFLAETYGNSLDSLPPIDPSKYPNCAKLVADIKPLTQSLDSINPTAASLSSSLVSFENSLTIPDTFQHQVQDLTALFTDAINILDFFETLNVKFVDDLVEPIIDVTKNQNGKLSTLSSAIPDLLTAIQNIDKASKSVIAAAPDTKIICTTLHRIEGWSMSVNQTVQLIEEGYNAVTKLPEDQQASANAKIDSFKKNVEAIVGTLVSRIETMTTQGNNLTVSINGLMGGLNAYTGALKSVTQNSELLSNKGLSVMDRVVHILNIVNSIIDPLSGLLQATHCVDGSNPIKSTVGMAADMMKDAGKAAATADPQLFLKFAEELAENVLPIGTLATSVNNATSDINNDAVNAFDQHSTSLVSSLATLKSEMNQTEHYETTIHIWENGKETGKTKKIEVDNDLFSQTLLAEANEILKTLGITTPTNPELTY